MSNTINATVNLYTSGQQQSMNSSSQVVNIFPTQEVNQTGTLGVVSPSNPDSIFMTGIFILNINTSLPVYRGSLLVATMTIAGSESTIYDRSDLNRSPFAFVNGIQMMYDLIDDPAVGADIPQVGDYVVFVQDDEQGGVVYLEGDRGAWNGNNWIKYGPDEPIDISITPTNPVAEIPVAVKTQSSSNAGIFSTYSEYANSAKNTGVFVNFDTNGVNNIDITSVLKPVTESNGWERNNGVNIIIEPTGVARLSEPPYTTVSSIAEMEGLPTQLDPDDPTVVPVVAGDYVYFTADDFPYRVGDKGSWNGSTWVREPEINYLIDVGAISPSQYRLNLLYSKVAPEAPQNLSVVPAFRSLDVFWEPPLDDGGSPVINYDIQFQKDGESTWTEIFPPVADTSGVIPNLEPSTFYFVRVRANNAIGSGPFVTTSTPYAPNNTNPAPISSLDFNSANPIRVRIRRDLKANWDAADPVLAIGEPGYELDTNYLKVGNGVSSWTGLPTIKVPDSTINFPVPADVFLKIKSNPFESQPVVSCNLSQGVGLSLIAGTGMNLIYSDLDKSVTFDLKNTFDPINSGTIANPQTTGTPGTVNYDENRIYICVKQNEWKRVLQDIPWFNFVPLNVSDFNGNYPSDTQILSSGAFLTVTSNGDPYPALAGDPLTNDGFTPRGGFLGGYIPVNQNINLAIEYRGGENTSNPMPVVTNEFVGVTVNGVPIKPPSYSGPVDVFPAPASLQWNLVYWSRYFGMDDCNGLVFSDGAYNYYGGGFVSACWDDPKFYGANSYYSNTDFNQDYMRHPDGHSKIIGLALDGYPIYGPFGYSDALDTGSIIKRMETGYTTLFSDSHRPVDFKYTNELVIDDSIYPLVAGAFVEDFEFSNAGDLDAYNGRYCKTPDYPNGTYAYFLTFSDDGMLFPEYPYIIGTSTREQRSV